MFVALCYYIKPAGKWQQKIPLDKLEQMYYNRFGKDVSGLEQVNTPIDVIAMCSANGEIRPLRLRMETEDHQLMRVDIDEIISSRQVQYVGIEAQIFLCRAMVRGKKWLFELKYTIRSHSWCLLRKVY